MFVIILLQLLLLFFSFTQSEHVLIIGNGHHTEILRSHIRQLSLRQWLDWFKAIVSTRRVHGATQCGLARTCPYYLKRSRDQYNKYVYLRHNKEELMSIAYPHTVAFYWLGMIFSGLDHEKFTCENLFLSRIWQNCEIFNP